MIPKKIHYIRVGGKEMPEIVKKCLNSWKEKLPDYKLCLWNESNFDFSKNKFAKGAYEAKKWAFVSDYIRIWVLYHEGGIYLDTDVEVIKSLDGFLNCKGFGGFQQKDLMQTGVMGCEKGNPFMGEVLKYYEKQKFDPNNMVSNPNVLSDIAKEKFGFKGGKGDKLVKFDNDIFLCYPRKYFCPVKYSQYKFNYKKLKKDKDCYAIHYFLVTWSGKSKLRLCIESFFANICRKLYIYDFIEKIYVKITK